ADVATLTGALAHLLEAVTGLITAVAPAVHVPQPLVPPVDVTPDSPTVDIDFSPMGQAIMNVLAEAEKPLTARTISLRMGRHGKVTAQMKNLLARFQEGGQPLIRKVPLQGYWLCSRPYGDEE